MIDDNTNEKQNFKKYVSCANFPYCGKCGEHIYRKNRRTINIARYDKHTGQYQRKLCSLCMSCYGKLLDFLEVPDI